MQVHITQSDAPSVPKEIELELLAMEPKTFMLWNARVFKANDLNGVHWEGRWEIWCELRESQHEDANNELYRTDRWNTDFQTWMRKLQLYQTEEGNFAPVDRALVIGLNMADTWADRLWYQNNIEVPHDHEEAVRVARSVEAASGGASYYRNFNNPTVGGHRGSSRAGWRHRIR